MPFVVLCCASSRSYKQAEAEAETRRARIVPTLDPNGYTHPFYRPRFKVDLEVNGEHLPPPKYEDVAGSISLGSVPVLVVGDEKNGNILHVTEVSGQEGLQPARESGAYLQAEPTGVALQHEGSDRSSIISIPSTQVTGLGSSYTGTTTLRGDATGRVSRDDGSRRPSESGTLSRSNTLHENIPSRPPSYYESSLQRQRRSPSPTAGSEVSGSEASGDVVFRHPVMREGWFEHLRGTRGEGEWRR
jgi:hypothetical protein